MIKSIINLSIGFLIGVVVGAGAMLIAFPYLFPPPVVNESVAQFDGAFNQPASFTGSFREDAPGQDFAHWAKGRISVHHRAGNDAWIELKSDFEASPGPNYWVYLNSRPGIDDEADFLADSERIPIAKLKSFEGSQIYPTTISQLNDKQALTIWCETFSQYIGSADFVEHLSQAIEPSG